MLGQAQATVTYDEREYEITLRIVPDRTMQNALVLRRDFMKVAKLSLSREEKEIVDIMNIEVGKSDTRITADDMRINESLPAEVKVLARDLFNRMNVMHKGRRSIK